MSRRRDVLGLLSELERQRLGEAAIRRGRLDIRLARTDAERGTLVSRRAAARETPTADALPHLGAFQRDIAARISLCDADRDAIEAELETVEEEVRACWRWSETLKAVARRSS